MFFVFLVFVSILFLLANWPRILLVTIYFFPIIVLSRTYSFGRWLGWAKSKEAFTHCSALHKSPYQILFLRFYQSCHPIFLAKVLILVILIPHIVFLGYGTIDQVIHLQKDWICWIPLYLKSNLAIIISLLIVIFVL